MRTWYFSEMAYHPAWDKGLAPRLAAGQFPSENLDPQEAGTSVEPLSRRVRAVRRSRAGHHGERAPQHRHLHDRVCADGAVDYCSRNQERRGC